MLATLLFPLNILHRESLSVSTLIQSELKLAQASQNPVRLLSARLLPASSLCAVDLALEIRYRASDQI